MRGQMLLIVVLVMVVIMTVGLSAATRTITNIRVSTDEENSERAFSAAEAGLEQALGRNLGVSGTLDNTSKYQTTIAQLSGVEFLLNNNLPILKDDAVDVWLSTYPNYTVPYYNGKMTIYWGSASDNCSTTEANNTMAALDIVVISGSTANPVATHYPVDPCPQRQTDNNFGNAINGGGNVSGKNFAYRTTIDVTNGLIARIIPLYSATPMAVKACNSGGGGCNTLPAQGTIIQSTGISENAQRKIVSFQSYPKLPPEIFPFVLFSPN
jgi:Tfp pilus assembly protein PilX